jgi:hypothetical protein
MDGKYIETGLPLEDNVDTAIRTGGEAPPPLTAKHKTYMGSFLSFVILTFLNIALITFGVSVNFPFSASVPQFFWALGWYSLKKTSAGFSALMLLAGVVLLVIYFVLYLLSKKRVWPILTALVLISIDTVFLLYLAIGDLRGSIIDILFHAWVLWSIINLYRTRRKLGKAA